MDAIFQNIEKAQAPFSFSNDASSGLNQPTHPVAKMATKSFAGSVGVVAPSNTQVEQRPYFTVQLTV